MKYVPGSGIIRKIAAQDGWWRCSRRNKIITPPRISHKQKLSVHVQYSPDSREERHKRRTTQHKTNNSRTEQCCSARRNNAIVYFTYADDFSSSYPGGEAASWCIQRTRMVIHQHPCLLLCSCCALIPQMIKVYIHNAALPALRCSLPHCLPLSLTETKLPLLPVSPVFSTLLHSPFFPFCSSVRLFLYLLCLSLSLTCADSLLLPHATYALPLCFAFSHWYTLSSYTQRYVPLPRPPHLLALSVLRIFLSSVCLCFYLFLSLSFSLLTASLLLGLAGRLTCVHGDACSAASLKVALSSGEEKRGWVGGLYGRGGGGGVFGGVTTLARGGLTNKRTWTGKHQLACDVQVPEGLKWPEVLNELERVCNRERATRRKTVPLRNRVRF